MIDAIGKLMPKPGPFWPLLGLAIIIICLWKIQQIHAVIGILKDPKLRDLPEEEKTKQVNYLTIALYAYGVTLMCFLAYSLVNFFQ